jgi:hypothetical protein
MSNDAAFIDLSEHTHVRAIWFVGTKTMDVLGWMYRPAGKAWEIGYRFRFYKDARVFNSADEKRGWFIKPSAAEPSEAELKEIAAAMDTALGLLAAKLGATAQRVDLNCMGLEAGLIISQQPWANTWSAGGQGGSA